MQYLQPGDHIRVQRGIYSHHGIYEGDGKVVHFTDLQGGKKNAMIRRGTFEEFKRGGRVQVVQYTSCYDAARTLERARSKIGASGYDLFHNNCEHFATWCKTGEHESSQVRTFRTVGAIGGGLLVVSAWASTASALDDEEVNEEGDVADDKDYDDEVESDEDDDDKDYDDEVESDEDDDDKTPKPQTTRTTTMSNPTRTVTTTKTPRSRSTSMAKTKTL